jgi:ferritin-like metal-binding protein YciE
MLQKHVVFVDFTCSTIFRNFPRLKIALSNLTADGIMEGIMDSKKQRAQNFSEQDCVLLAHLMGETVESFGISRYRVLKHKFNDSKDYFCI